jgi:signal transduction protein with GAF and PtsI domain
MTHKAIHKDITYVLADVASAVVGHFDTKILLDQIINTTKDTLHAKVCSIFLEDKENAPGILKCEAGSGFAEKIIGIAQYKFGEGFTGSVAKYGGEYNIKSRQELESLEIGGAKVWKGNFDAEQWPSGKSEFRNLIALPLIIKDQTLGVIKAENKIEVFGDCFSEEDLTIFKTIANVVALTIENAKLVQMAESQSKKIAGALAEIASGAAGQFDMEVLLDQIINTTMDSLHAEVCSIFLENKKEEPGVIKCVAGSGFARRIVNIAKYRSGEGLTGAVFKFGEGYNSKNPDQHMTLTIGGREVWKGKFDNQQWPSGKSEFRNGIGLPLKIKDQILGVIKVENKIKKYGDFFSDEDLMIFKTITNVVALIIENARLVQKTEEQSKNISGALAGVASKVVGQFDMKVLLSQIINTTKDTLHARVCSIFLEDKEKAPGILKCEAGSGFAEKIVGVAQYKFGEGFTGFVAEFGGEYNIKSRQELENLQIGGKKVWKGNFDADQWPSGKSEFRNLIALPLIIKDQTLGVIKAENKIEEFGDFFSDEDLMIFRTIANVVALTIENARLHDKIETQLKTISAKAAHRINNQAANYDGIDLDLEFELKNPIVNKDNLSQIHKRLITTTKNLKYMIGEFRNFGKPIELQKTRSSINQIIRDEVWLARPQGIAITEDYDNNIPSFPIDSARFAESMKELLRNAMKALNMMKGRNGKIHVSTKLVIEDNMHQVQIRIEDNGPGFPSDFPVFKPFNTTDPQSTGLGLSTVKELIEKHGGTIGLKSSILGGACIECILPITN